MKENVVYLFRIFLNKLIFSLLSFMNLTSWSPFNRVVSPFLLTVLSFSLLSAFAAQAEAQQSGAGVASSVAPETQQPASGEQTTMSKPAAVKTQPLQKVELKGQREYDERRQDTATKIVVTQEEIARFGDSSVSDVLKRLPGVTIGGVQGRGGEIRMRGLGSGYTQILLNGEPSPPGFSLDSLAPELIERIEIIRAATAELSTQAIAGAINIVLKKTVHTAQKEIKAGGAYDGGKFSENINFQLSDKDGIMSYAISGNANRGQYERPVQEVDSGTDMAGNPNLMRHVDISNHGTWEGIGLTPRINWNLSNGDVITTQSFMNASRFNGYQNEQTYTSIGALPPFVSDAGTVKSSGYMFRTNINWVHKLADSAKLDVKFGLNYNKRSSDNTLNAYDAVSQILLRQTHSDSTDQGFTSSGKYSAPFVENHAIVFGWDGGLSRRGETDLQNDQVSSTSTLKPNDINEDYHADVWRMALFAQDEWNVSKQLSVYGGLRWEMLKTDSSGSAYGEVNNRSSVWSPIFQLLWKLPDSKNDQIRFGITRTYKAPGTWQMLPRRFYATNPGVLNPDRMGNPDLKPELAWGIDAAYEHYLPDGGMLSASVYMRRINDIIRDKLIVLNGYVNMPVNDGLATTRGIELEAKFPLRSLFKDAPAIDFRSNLSFNWSDLKTVTGPNNRLDSQTPISANLGLDYKLDSLPLTLGGNFSFQDAGPVTISAQQTSYRTPKRELDIYGLWKFDKNTSLRLSFANLLHQMNLSASTYQSVGGSQTQTYLVPTTTAARILFEHKF